MVDHDDAVLELGGEVEREAGPWQTGSRRWDALQQVVHDVVAARALMEDSQRYKTLTRTSLTSTYQVLIMLIFRKSLRGTLMPFVATSLEFAESFITFYLLLKQKQMSCRTSQNAQM